MSGSSYLGNAINERLFDLKKKQSSLARMKQLGAYKPDLRFRFRPTLKPGPGFIEVFPIKKIWVAIIIVGVMLAGFVTPLFTLNMDFGNSEDLFDLTTSLFQLFWAFGWSLGVLFLLVIFLALLLAREVLIVEPQNIILRIELLGFGIETGNPLPYLSNLRIETGEDVDPGVKWRGQHLVFDYMNIPVSFAHHLDEKTARQLMEKINAALSNPIPASLPSDIEALANNTTDLANIEEDKTPESSASNQHELMTDGGEVRQVFANSPGTFQDKKSLYMLCMANLVPLAGVFILNWTIAEIMLLFWFESAIIGFFNIVKMFRITGPVAIFASIFFLGHFGAFMSVHLMFIFGLFIEDDGMSSTLAEVSRVFINLWPAILGLIISHGFSYKVNFLDKKEYLNMTLGKQMQKPYTRIVLMHLTIIFGGFLVLALDARILALVLLIGMKIVVDAGAHIKEHRKI